MIKEINLGAVFATKNCVILPLIADETGRWAFMTAFNGAYQYVQFDVKQGNNIIIPVMLNYEYDYKFKLYKNDNSIFNDISYTIHTKELKHKGSLPINDLIHHKTFIATHGQVVVGDTDAIGAKQVEVFVEGAVIKLGKGEEEYLFDKLTGIFKWNQPLVEGQKVSIIIIKTV